MDERMHSYQVVVIGAGPAGLSAAEAAAAQGCSVLLLDAQPAAGGQVWRRDAALGVPAPSRKLQSRLDALGVSRLPQSEVVGAFGRQLLVRCGRESLEVGFGSLVIATGARELLLPFPGWTLPGVTGAGGAQALVKQGWPVRGKRVLVAGSGPLLLASAETLQRHGASVLGIHEQLGRTALAGFAAGLWRWPGKLVQAAQLRGRLRGVSYRADSHVVRALGNGRLEAVEIREGGRISTIECDMLACGFGLVPNVELPDALGCDLDESRVHPLVRVDAYQRTSVEDIYAVGEACGIGGVDCARVEGRIAGLAAAGVPERAHRLFRVRSRARRFGEHLERHFILRDELRALADDDTIVCRCEDVTMGALNPCQDVREMRLMTRCGMGPCQGRICGTVIAETRRLPRAGLRFPVFPVPLAVLAGSSPKEPAAIFSGVVK
jgi:NADPH-dependent 2,4-dienoyl-CoA reductase/sulfur reductase-like enzyme